VERVELDPGRPEDAGLGGWPAAGEGADAEHEFGEMEWLREVVVGAEAEAADALRRGVGGGGANPTLDPKQQAQLLAFARCMRVHGIQDFPDPARTGGFPPSIGRIARDLPAFRSALSACLHIAHGAIVRGPNGNPMWPVDR
jgi:hypothetical protein